MILPLTQNGGPSPIGVSMRNAAQLAISVSGSTSITLMIQDDHSSPDAATQAAQSELGAGAQLILGPVFANDVRTASAAAKSAGRPMIAFSTDVTVAAPGVYLLSFLIQGYVDRILQYAVSNGKKSFGIMAPQNDYGNVAAQRRQPTTALPDICAPRLAAHPNVNLRPFPVIASSKLPVRDRERRMVPAGCRQAKERRQDRVDRLGGAVPLAIS